ncbi:MAG TPA: SPASM domain-containing protein, partial [Victivallales bacterium]|nr:SPASM domain-containing protein [Victivallales bacterium]
LTAFSVKPPQWGEFLCKIFDEWYKYDRFKISVRLFDSILIKLVDNISNVCTMSDNCRQYFVVEHNGDVYPCDFFVLPELRLGNIMTNTWDDFINNPIYNDFGKRKSRLNQKCKECKYLFLCAGCCPKNRFGKGPVLPEKLSALCEGWELFFSHTIERFKGLAEDIKIQRQKELEVVKISFAKVSNPLRFQKVGRNEACPCGSGKKYKKCCGK